MTIGRTAGQGRSYLWLTRFYPYPLHAGDRIYSARLIETLAALGCSVTVLCTDAAGPDATPILPPEGPAQRVEWVRSPAGGTKGLWAYPVSRLPRQALALATPAQHSAVERLLRRQRWDAILVDYVAMGWVLPLVEARWPDRATRPPLVYVSHNHEASLRRTAVRESTASLPTRLLQRLDAERVIELEKRLIAAATLVTAITETDRDLYRREAPHQTYAVLRPGYDGPVVTERTLGPDTPRRVVVVGSFDWIVKQQNLMGFLGVAAEPLAAEGIGIDIVGRGPEGFLDIVRRRFPSVAIHGAVDRIEPYLQAARISVVPERIGGGFKYKVLNGVFQRIPVFALSGSVAGMPPGAIRFCDGFDGLVRAIVEAIDDFDGLNALQREAFALCKGRFDWFDCGRILCQAIDDLGGPRRAMLRPVPEPILAGQV